MKNEEIHKFDTTENNMIDVETFEKLKETLLCSVCADVYKDPMNVRQCLHKFCSQCIEDYNRIYKKECPACRTPIGCRRQLRRDFKIQLIIKSIIKETTKFNEIEYRLRQQRLAKELSTKKNAYSDQMAMIYKKQAAFRDAYIEEERIKQAKAAEQKKRKELEENNQKRSRPRAVRGRGISRISPKKTNRWSTKVIKKRRARGKGQRKQESESDESDDKEEISDESSQNSNSQSQSSKSNAESSSESEESKSLEKSLSMSDKKLRNSSNKKTQQ